MNEDDRESKTINYYNQQTDKWVAKHANQSDETWWGPEMERFHELLPGGRVLEIGFGGGRDAKSLINYGYEYIGTDASEGFLAAARKANPSGKFIIKNVHDLDFPDEDFDGFWTAATLLHIPLDLIEDALAKVSRVVKKGGTGFISLKKGEGERSDEETGRHFTYWQKENFSEVLKKAGFSVIDFRKVAPGDKSGTKDTWLCFYVRKD